MRTSESGQELAEGCGEDLVASRRGEAGEAHLLGPVLEGLHKRFFPATAQKEMEEQFIKLQ